MSEFRAEENRALALGLRPRVDWQARTQQPRPAPPALKPPRSLPLELAALQGLVDPALLAAAARRAEFLGVGGDEVLRCHGIVSADVMTQALADRLGLEIDTLEDDRPPRSPRLLEAAITGVLSRVKPSGRKAITVAPRGLAVRRLANALANNPELARHLRIASPERLSAHVRRVGATELAREAVLGLHTRWPDLSAVARGHHGLRWFAILSGILMIVAALAAPGIFLFALEGFFGFAFLTWIALRLLSCRIRSSPTPELDLPERRLPVYTVIVPLYREAQMVPQLIAALRRLQYPREKLDIKLVVEADDAETRAAVAALGLKVPFEVIVSPLAGPRTKPKALAAALPFARGTLLVVYDAEDVPEPDQLRVALAAFRAGPPELACVQARLAIDNAADNWLTHQYAAEYAGLFDVFLPALADLKLPLPLGGTSNHFHTETLRKIGGWDPFNVTEDADLGMRLARFGCRIGVVASTTWEEAPVRFMPWLRQRTRWFKGWMQTWLVHMRAPSDLRRELDLRGFIALQLLVGGTVFAALVHPFFLAFVISDTVTGTFIAPSETAEEIFRKWLALTTLVAGYTGSAVLGLVGLYRRKMLGIAWVLVTIPIYWLLLSLAAWRAVIQLVIAPHLWEKTEHGLARTTRHADADDAAMPAPRAVSARSAKSLPRT
jgi:cellulose synthase/poly-beta-1,6-N-acetylglucosamine synthase-like glycosyltransferase